MLKKITALALILTLVLSLSTAFAWSCPTCGSEMSGKFCTECGTKKPANICPSCGTDFGDAAPKFCSECGTKLGEAATAAPTATPAPEAEEPEITYATQLESGSIAFMWNSDGVQEYTMELVLKQSDNPYADRDAYNGFYTISGKNSVGLVTYRHVIPGEDYWIGLFDAQGRGHYAPFEGDPTTTYSECSVAVYAAPIVDVNGEEERVDAHSLQMIESGDATKLYYIIEYDNPGEAKEYNAHIILEAPNGARYAVAADLAFEAETKSNTGWKLHLQDFFSSVKNGFGEIPAGEYKVHLYLDMGYVGTQTFSVKDENAGGLMVTGFAPNGDGTVELSWMGGTAPYTVSYCLRTSDDSDADGSAAVDAGFFRWHELELHAQQTTLTELIPGEKYWIYISDANNGFVSYAIKTLTGTFTDFDTQLIVSSNPVDASASNVAAAYQNGVYMGFVYDNPGEPRTMQLQCVIDYGEGRKKVTEAVQWQAESGKNCLPLGEYASLEALLKSLSADVGFEPDADIALSIYLDGKLAGEAVIPVAQEEEGVFFENIMTNGDGTLTLSWRGGKAPYSLNGLIKMSDDFFADRDAARNNGSYWSFASGLEANTATLDDLIPGVDYWIVVMDAEGNGRYQHLIGTATESFDDVEASLEVLPRTRTGENISAIASIPADTAGVDDDTEYGVRLVLNYTNPGEARETHWQIVLQTPDGDRYVTGNTMATLQKGENKQLGWNFYNLDWDFANQLKHKGAIPEGDWSISLYVDGDLAGTGSFTVATPRAVVITGVEDQGNGKHLITWEDSGKGPYDVHYFQRFTDDRESDRSDGRGSGWWTAEGDVAGTSAVLEYLVPGKSYWLTVTDSEGTISSVTYDVPAGGDAGYDMTVQNKPRKAVNDSYTDLETFSAAVLNQDYTESYGLYLKLQYHELNADTSKPAQWVITLPDGVVFCEYAFDLNLFEDGNTYWDCYTLDWVFKTVKRWYGEVLQGEYRFDIYVEGDYAGGTTFTVGE